MLGLLASAVRQIKSHLQHYLFQNPSLCIMLSGLVFLSPICFFFYAFPVFRLLSEPDKLKHNWPGVHGVMVYRGRSYLQGQGIRQVKWTFKGTCSEAWKVFSHNRGTKSLCTKKRKKKGGKINPIKENKWIKQKLFNALNQKYMWWFSKNQQKIPTRLVNFNQICTEAAYTKATIAGKLWEMWNWICKAILEKTL